MVPIATYREARFESKCRFELYEDHLRASGTVTGGKYEATIPLTMLHPQCQRGWGHSLLFYSAVFPFLISIIALFIVVVFVNHETFAPPAGVLAAITTVAFIMALANGRKIEKALFLSDVGVPMVSISRAGREAGQFDSFVAALVEQIEKARGPERRPSVPAPASITANPRPSAGPISTEGGSRRNSIPIANIFLCPDCWAELDMRLIERGSLVKCPRCARAFRRARASRRSWLSLGTFFIGGLAFLGIALVVFMVGFMLPMIEKDGVNKPEGRFDPLEALKNDVLPDPPPDPQEEAGRAAARRLSLQGKQAREQRLLEGLKQRLHPGPGRPLWTVPFASQLSASLAFSPDGESLAGICEGRAILWNVRTAERRQVFETARDWSRLAFSPDGGTLATFGTRHAQLWDVKTGLARNTPSLAEEGIGGIAFSPSGQTLVSIKRINEFIPLLCFRDPLTGEPQREPIKIIELDVAAVFSPDGRTLACLSTGTVSLKRGDDRPAQTHPPYRPAPHPRPAPAVAGHHVGRLHRGDLFLAGQPDAGPGYAAGQRFTESVERREWLAVEGVPGE